MKRFSRQGANVIVVVVTKWKASEHDPVIKAPKLWGQRDHD